MRKRSLLSRIGLAAFSASLLLCGTLGALASSTDALGASADGYANGYLTDSSTLHVNAETTFNLKLGDWTYTNEIEAFQFASGYVQWYDNGQWNDVVFTFGSYGDVYNDVWSGYYQVNITGHTNIIRTQNFTYSNGDGAVRTSWYAPDANLGLQFRFKVDANISDWNQAKLYTLCSISDFVVQEGVDLRQAPFYYNLLDYGWAINSLGGGNRILPMTVSASSQQPSMDRPIDLYWPFSNAVIGEHDMCYVVPYRILFHWSSDEWQPIEYEYLYVMGDEDDLSWLSFGCPFAWGFAGEKMYFYKLNDYDVKLYKAGVEQNVSDSLIEGHYPSYREGSFVVPRYEYEYYGNWFSYQTSHNEIYGSNGFDYALASCVDVNGFAYAYGQGWDNGRFQMLNDVANGPLENQASYQAGYDRGYSKGYAEGAQGGPAKTMFSLFGAVVSVPINVLNGLSPMTIWDTPLISIIVTLLFIGMFLFLVKRIIFRG